MADEYFKKLIIPIVMDSVQLCNFMENILVGQKNLAQLIDSCQTIVKCASLFPEQAESVRKHVSDALLVALEHKAPSIEGFYTQLEREREFLELFPELLSLFTRRKAWLEEKTRVQPIFSWSMANAEFNEHPRVQAFMISDEEEMKYPFKLLSNLREFQKKFGGSNNVEKRGYSIQVTELPKKIAQITKTRALFDQLMVTYNKYVQELEVISEFLSSLETSFTV